MIQNISQNRSDKKIKKTDLQYIGATAWLTAYPGITRFYVSGGYEKTYRPACFMYYVKGLSNGNASCVWRINLWTPSCSDPSCGFQGPFKSSHSRSSVKFNTDVSPTQIHPNLKINSNEAKIIVETYFCADGYSNKNGTTERGQVSYGLKFVNPPKTSIGTTYDNFHSVVTFTPKPGLFDETAPL